MTVRLFLPVYGVLARAIRASRAEVGLVQSEHRNRNRNRTGQDRTGHTTSTQKRLKGIWIPQRRRDQKLLQPVLVEQQSEG